ncbi:uncharacterized protein [Apostichopus japonicus]|uniref:uncharacterized protein n=1 Tax=Stichopus japonicus TaxID=307972 RepID=UPI003AB22AAB
MGAYQSLWAIRGYPIVHFGEKLPSYEAATSPSLLPALEGLVNLDVYKIALSGYSGSCKVLNSSGEIVCSIKSISTPCCASDINREVLRVRDPQKRGVLSVYKCEVGCHYNSPSFQPGALIGYVNMTNKNIFSYPQFEILFENGESTLLVKSASGYTYNVLSQAGNHKIGEFGPTRNSSCIEGSIQRDLDVRMKVGVILAAAWVLCIIPSDGSSTSMGGGGGDGGC